MAERIFQDRRRPTLRAKPEPYWFLRFAQAEEEIIAMRIEIGRLEDVIKTLRRDMPKAGRRLGDPVAPDTPTLQPVAAKLGARKRAK